MAIEPLAHPWMIVPFVLGPLAALVAWAGWRSRQARLLALFLALSALAALNKGWAHASPDAGLATLLIRGGTAAVLASALAHLLFLGTMDVPLGRRMRHRAVRAALATGIALTALLLLALPSFFAAPAMPMPRMHGYSALMPVPTRHLVPVLVLLSNLAGVTVSLQLLRSNPAGSAGRRKAVVYAMAFLLRDAGGIVFATLTLARNAGAFASAILVVQFVVIPIVTTLAALLLAYGILREQLFDLDLRIKRGLARGTLAGVFVAAFVMAAETAENVLDERLGLIAGGLAAGALVLALRPLERAAQRVADAAMPTVTATPEYLAYRKLDVYRAAVESAHESGGISARERAALARLRAKLGIHEGDARRIEGDVRGEPPAAEA